MQMNIQFAIKGRIPSKKNSRATITRGNKTFLIDNKNYRQWHKKSSLQIQEVKKLENIQGISILFYFPDNRKADLTNKAESIMDLLVDNKIIPDDCWQEIPFIGLISKGIDRENPRAEVIITGEFRRKK